MLVHQIDLLSDSKSIAEFIEDFVSVIQFTSVEKESSLSFSIESPRFFFQKAAELELFQRIEEKLSFQSLVCHSFGFRRIIDKKSNE